MKMDCLKFEHEQQVQELVKQLHKKDRLIHECQREISLIKE